MTSFPSTEIIIEITYLAATALFILSLKWMSSPTTARQGVWAGELGMLLAVAGTLLNRGIVDYKWVAIALVLGSIIGVPLGKVQMTAVPQRTALSHAFGALCVTLVGTAEFYLRAPEVPKFMMAVLSLEIILGSLTLTGSLMAAGKLQEVLPQRPITYKGQNLVNLSLLGVAIVVAVLLVVDPSRMYLFPMMIIIPLIFGVMMIVPIGGADMPTVISLLNSYAGLSAAAMGFVLDSKLLIIAGALDGASGFILSVNMSKAMNRSFSNVLFGAFGQEQTSAAAAGADIPYDKLLDMEEINGDFPQTDVALIIGANDVTNPAARTDHSSPIFGMPILDVDRAHTVMVIKRSMNPGFAGIDNPLYYLDQTLMLFGDAQQFEGGIEREW